MKYPMQANKTNMIRLLITGIHTFEAALNLVNIAMLLIKMRGTIIIRAKPK